MFLPSSISLVVGISINFLRRLLAPAMGAAASAASRRAAEALAQRWAFLVAEQGDAEELQALGGRR